MSRIWRRRSAQLSRRLISDKGLSYIRGKAAQNCSLTNSYLSNDNSHKSKAFFALV